MTTESTQDTRRGVSPLLGAAAAGAVLVVGLVVAGALSTGSPGALGAAVGGGVTLVVFALGIATVDVVARLVPQASLLVALLTYVLQLLLLALVVVGLERSGAAGEALSREWFAIAVIAVTMVWLAVQLVTGSRQRIPVYDLPTQRQPGGER